MCERGEVFVLRSFCYFKSRNRLDPSEKAVSSYNARCIYCCALKKKKKTIDAKQLVCVLEGRIFLFSPTLKDYYCEEGKKYKMGRRWCV